MSMIITSASATHTGRVRKNNEDSTLVDDDLGLYAVADGMGGHNAGEVASRLACDSLKRRVQRASGSERSSTTLLQDVFASVHADVVSASEKEYGLWGMGCTLTAAWVRPHATYVAHAGDSVAFLVRPGVVFRSLTEAQSVGSRLNNCIGHKRESFKGAVVSTFVPVVGDLLILATDGLTHYFNAQGVCLELSKFVGHRPSWDPEIVANRLVDRVLEEGGIDNVAVVCAVFS